MKIEPHADMRQMASVVRQVFEAFTDVGFSDVQALMLTETWFQTTLENSV